MSPHGRSIKKFFIRNWRKRGKPAAGAELAVLKAIRASKTIRSLETALLKNVNSGILTERDAFDILLRFINAAKIGFLSNPSNTAFASRLEYLKGGSGKLYSAEEKQEYKAILNKITNYHKDAMVFGIGKNKDREIEIKINNSNVSLTINKTGA